jgi:hypothetical protein
MISWLMFSEHSECHYMELGKYETLTDDVLYLLQESLSLHALERAHVL